MLSTLLNQETGLSLQPINWERLIQQASAQRLLPALAEGLDIPLPPEIRNLLTTAESLNAERNQIILAEAARAATLLNQIGIQPVALKGLAYLLTNTYPNHAARYLLDIDLLIPAAHLLRAAHHLLDNGYYQNEPGTFLQFRHHFPSIRRAQSPSIELHRQLILGRASRLLSPAALLAASQRLSYNGATFLIPSPTDLVNHLILHSQLAHPYHDRIFPPLRALVDLARLQKRFTDQIDWQALLYVYESNGESATLLLHLHQAREILGLPLPAHIPERLNPIFEARLKRRQILYHNPKLRFLDPSYLLLSLFSRRLRLLPLVLKTPSSWPHLLRLLITPTFYRNLVG
jgi:hypothetical protein